MLAAVHETVAVPEPLTLLGLSEPQVRPEGTVSARVTIPTKPFSAVIVIVEMIDWPALTPLGEVAEIVNEVPDVPMVRVMLYQFVLMVLKS